MSKYDQTRIAIIGTARGLLPPVLCPQPSAGTPLVYLNTLGLSDRANSVQNPISLALRAFPSSPPTNRNSPACISNPPHYRAPRYAVAG